MIYIAVLLWCEKGGQMDPATAITVASSTPLYPPCNRPGGDAKQASSATTYIRVCGSPRWFGPLLPVPGGPRPTSAIYVPRVLMI